MADISEQFENMGQDSLKRLLQFIEVPSLSRNPEGILQGSQFLTEIMAECGITTRIIPTAGNPVVFGELGNDRHVPTVMFYGHYDVQPAEPINKWDTSPFQPVIKNGRIYGRGASDNKGQLYANLKGVEAYWKNTTHPVNLKFLYEGEEEIGSKSLEGFIIDNKGLLKCDLLLSSDGQMDQSGLPKIILGNKGMIQLRITVREGQDLHSCWAPAVVNPIWRLVGILNSLVGPEGTVKVKGFYDNIRPIVPSELEMVETFPYDRDEVLHNLGIKRFNNYLDENRFYHELLYKPTFNINGLQGGSESVKTIVPGLAVVNLDIRLVPDQDCCDIFAKIQEHLNHNNFGDAELEVFTMAQPRRGDVKDQNLGLIKDAIKSVWGAEPLIYPNSTGTNPGWMFTKHIGINMIEIPFAEAGDNSHAPNETFPLDAFFKGVKTTAEILKNYSIKKATEKLNK